MNIWYSAEVLRGSHEGRTLGFPTINLSPQAVEEKLQEGVYACLVRHKEKQYRGVLFYGPRLVKNEEHPVLEIHILNFNKQIYGELVEFQPVEYIREVKNFSSMEDLRQEIKKDIKKTLNSTHLTKSG